MADWYVSAAAWSALPKWAASTAYTVGQIIQPLTAPAAGNKHAFRCTTAGTSGSTEPTWSNAFGNNNTIASGGATFTNVSGQGAYGWGAASGDLNSISSNPNTGWIRPALGDRVFVASDHTETIAGSPLLNFASGFGLIQFISVNRAGSVPPVAADVQSGASITGSGNFYIGNASEVFWHGFTFTLGSGGTNLLLGNNTGAMTFKNCAFVLAATGAASIGQGGGGAYGANILLDNVTVQFQNSSQYMAYGLGGTGFLTWINTPNAIQGAVPTNLFSNLNSNQHITCRGVDLSALTTTLFAARVSASYGIMKVLLDSCKIAAGMTRYAVSGVQPSTDEVELVNCWDGTNVVSERWHSGGSMTIDRSTTMNSGAQDDIGAYSIKLASSSRAENTQPMDSFPFDILNTLTGARTATVEIASSAALNNTDIRLAIEYQATSGSPVMSFNESIVNNLAASTALPSSSATWAGSPASKQQLQVSFTPAVAGRVRGLVKLNKPSTNVWVNPQIAIT